MTVLRTNYVRCRYAVPGFKPMVPSDIQQQESRTEIIAESPSFVAHKFNGDNMKGLFTSTGWTETPYSSRHVSRL
jgi:hypothetical protein